MNDWEICNGPAYWVPKRGRGEVPVVLARSSRSKDYEPVIGPAYPIVKRKRVPRGVERLRDRRGPRSIAPQVIAEVVREEAAEVRSANDEVRTGEVKPRVVGKPFGPKPRGVTAEDGESAEGR